MYAILTLDYKGRPSEEETADAYTVALAHADQLLHDHTKVIIAYKHPRYYQPLVTLTHERDPAPIPHDYTPED